MWVFSAEINYLVGIDDDNNNNNNNIRVQQTSDGTTIIRFYITIHFMAKYIL